MRAAKSLGPGSARDLVKEHLAPIRFHGVEQQQQD